MATKPGEPPSPRQLAFQHEVKLATPAGFVLPDLAAGREHIVSAPPLTVQLETTYFDSLDLALATAGISLRHRPGGDGPAWTLKMPSTAVGDDTTTEREFTFPDTGPTPPPGARDLLHPHLRSRILLPVACMAATRTTVEFGTRAQIRLAVVVHDDVTAYRAGELVGRFGEIEVKSDGPSRRACDLVDQLAEDLVTGGCTRIETTPKLLRAFGVLSPPGPPQPPLRRADRPQQPAVDLVAEALAGPAVALFTHDADVRLGESAYAVHQFRVATRRLRAQLRAFAPLLDPAWVDQLRAELGWLGRLTGPVRDADVLLERLTARLGELPEPDTTLGVDLLVQLSAERGRRREEMLAGLGSARYDLLLDAVARAVARPHLLVPDDGSGDAVRVLAHEAHRRWRAVRRSVDAAGTHAGPAELHTIRIRAKRARYTAEAAVSVVGGPARQLARAAETVQSRLGDVQDAVVAEEWLRTAAARDGNLALAANELIIVEQKEIDEQRRSWAKRWAKIEQKARRADRRLAETGRRQPR